MSTPATDVILIIPFNSKKWELGLKIILLLLRSVKNQTFNKVFIIFTIWITKLLKDTIIKLL